MSNKVAYFTNVLVVILFASGVLMSFETPFARAGAEPCVKCKTIKTNYCGGIGNDCASGTGTVFGCTGACDTCANPGTSYISITSSTDPTDGARKKANQSDCGKKATGGNCWRQNVASACYCKGATAGQTDGGCGKKDNYESCTPP